MNLAAICVTQKNSDMRKEYILVFLNYVSICVLFRM